MKCLPPFLILLLLPLSAAETHTTSLGTELLRIDGGHFVRGSYRPVDRFPREFPLSINAQYYGSAETPPHPTWITKPFFLAKTEVTRGEFAAFIAATGYKTTAEQGLTQAVGWAPTDVEKPLYQSHDFARTNAVSWRLPGFEQTDDHPVVGVSLSDARAFINWLSDKDGVRYRLPTESEWELCCRAGTETWFSFGDQPRDTVHRHANIGNVELEQHRKYSVERQWLLDWDSAPADGHVFTAPVASFAANPWGLHDLHGNVWEWCEDLWLDTEYKAYERPKYNAPEGIAVDPVNRDRPQTPVNDFHVIRGGSWYNGPIICRSAGRSFWDRDDAACYIGFRLARDADGPGARAAYERELATRKAVEAHGGTFFAEHEGGLRIEFRGEAFRESILAGLQFLPRLIGLNLSTEGEAAALSQAGIDAIARLSTVEHLAIHNNCKVEALDLKPLARLPLKELTFGRSVPTSDQQLTQLAALSTLEALNIHGTGGGVSDAGLAALGGNTNLRALAVWECDLSGDFLAAFVGAPLTELKAGRRHNGESSWTPAGFAQLAAFPDLKTLTLHEQVGLDDSAMAIIAGFTDLRTLEMRGCSGISDAAFSQLASCDRLSTLDLRKTAAGDRALTGIRRIPRLETLYLSAETLSDEGLAHLPKLFSVRRLILESDRITDAGLAPLCRINRLRDLEIQSRAVTGRGLTCLHTLPELRDIKLRCPGLTDEVFDALNRIRSLRKVRLAERGIQPAAALTDTGLLRMGKAPWITELWLPRNDTEITEAGMNELKALAPKVGVIPYTVEWK